MIDNTNPTVKDVTPLSDYRLRLLFSNNEVREFDVKPYLAKGIFKELCDNEYFNQVSVSFGAVRWPNDQDFSHDTLYILGEPISSRNAE